MHLLIALKTLCKLAIKTVDLSDISRIPTQFDRARPLLTSYFLAVAFSCVLSACARNDRPGDTRGALLVTRDVVLGVLAKREVPHEGPPEGDGTWIHDALRQVTISAPVSIPLSQRNVTELVLAS